MRISASVLKRITQHGKPTITRPPSNPRPATAITNCIDRLCGTLLPLSLHAITLNPYCHRRCAVARKMPKRQQIAFHGVPSDRAQSNRLANIRYVPFAVGGALVARQLNPD